MDARLNKLIEKHISEDGTLIALLQDIHEEYRFLPEDLLREVSKVLDVPLSTLFSLATFYNCFRLEPMGKHHLCACVGTACHVRGAPLIVDTIERDLAIKAGETSPNGNFTFDAVNCVGACALGPLVTLDGEFHGNMDQKKIKKILKDLKKND